MFGSLDRHCRRSLRVNLLVNQLIYALSTLVEHSNSAVTTLLDPLRQHLLRHARHFAEIRDRPARLSMRLQHPLPC